MNVLVLAAHPDDEVLGCGGTMARLAREGHAVYAAILGEGVASRGPRRSPAVLRGIRELKAASREAAKILGTRPPVHFGLPDNQFDAVPLLRIVRYIEALIGDVRPEVVYTQHGGDLNVDHVLTFRATLTATRPIKGCPVRAVYAYEVPSSTEWAFQQFEPRFEPNVFVDVSETIETKIRALRAYQSETRPFPHPRSAEAVRATAQRWGSVAGVKWAEAFQCIREIR